MKSVGKVIKVIALSISFFIYAFFILRLCTGGDPKAMQKIIWNDTTIAAYEQNPETFEALEQEQQSQITDDGRFWISNVVYLPEAKQLQLTIKYNNSTLKYLKEALETPVTNEDGSTETAEPVTLPDEPFDYSLRDDQGNRYQTYSYEVGKKQNYNYRRLVFENIDLTDVAKMYVDIYYVGAIDYEETTYGTLVTWDAERPTVKRDVQEELPAELKT